MVIANALPKPMPARVADVVYVRICCILSSFALPATECKSLRNRRVELCSLLD